MSNEKEKEVNMYDKEFSEIYNHYGWDTFSITMGNAILEFLKKTNVKIIKHLDLACGVGTLCHLLWEQGIPTKGIDISKSMIQLAKEKYPKIPFEIADIITYQSKEKYNLITCTCDAINHILKKQDLETLFKNIDTYLEKEGYFIFDVIDEQKLLLNQKWKSDRGNNIYVEYLITKENELLKNYLEVYENNIRIANATIKERIYSKEEILKFANKIGWKILKCEPKIGTEMLSSNTKLFYILQK